MPELSSATWESSEEFSSYSIQTSTGLHLAPMSGLRFYDSYRSIISYGRRTGLFLPWMYGEKHYRLLLCYALLCMLYISSKVLCTLFALSDTDEFAMKIFILSITVYFFSGQFLCVFFLTRGKQLMAIVSTVDDINNRILQGNLGEKKNFTKLYDANVVLLKKFGRFMCVVTCICAAVYCVTMPLIDLIQGHYGRSPWAIGAQCQLAKEVQKVPSIFELIVIEEVLNFLLPGFHKFVTDIIILGLLRTQSIQFSYLSASVKNCCDESAENYLHSSKLILWLKLHQDVITNYSKMVSLFSPLLVLYSMGTITMIAGTIMYEVEAKNITLFQTVSGCGYMCVMMMQLYLVSDLATEVTAMGERVAFAIYSIPWYEMDSRTKGCIRFAMSVASRPLHLEGYMTPAFKINRETYLNLFFNVISAYIGLTKIKELNEEELNFN